MAYECVIGLEVHVELLTVSKMFCACANRFGAPPNSLTCPVCLGLPGALPVLNGRAVEISTMVGLALNCRINAHNQFDRKNYFYADMPKNYQISQLNEPLAVDGRLELAGGRTVGIRRAHMEEDVGKLLHPEGADHSLLDFNRSGVPLLEIVTEPEIASPGEAQEFLESLKTILRYLEASDCNMEEGSLRCDANISLRPAGGRELGTKVEVKNMNSFRSVRLALEYEIERQSAVLGGNGTEKLVQETRLWDEKSGRTRAMRSKEEAQDYRYFPEPDLVPVTLSDDFISRARQAVTELPAQKRARFARDYQLPDYDAQVLTADRGLADFFEAAARLADNPKTTANWVMTEVLSLLKEKAAATVGELGLAPENLAAVVRMVSENRITAATGKKILRQALETGRGPEEIVSREGLAQLSGGSELETAVDQALAENRKTVEDYRGGKHNALGFLVGQVMRKTGGQANPGAVQKLLREKLG